MIVRHVKRIRPKLVELPIVSRSQIDLALTIRSEIQQQNLDNSPATVLER